GVQHAHMKGILHRDLKPGNILVREVDGRPQVKIIDFGLAQPVDPLQIRATLHEALHTIVGTLAYMSPEQADRVEGDLDTRTDVFSLGVVLYELLTGKVPIEADQIKRAGMLDVGGLLREYVPQKPSTRLSQLGPELATAAAERSLSPGHLCARIRGELDWVTMKAIANDRGRRYASVQDLRRDIERFLQNRPVHAGPPSAWYSARKWAQRHLAGLLVAAVLVLGGAAFLATAGSLAAKAKEAELRRELVAKAWLIGDYLERADDELWPADAEHAPAMRAWLRETEHYPDLDVELHAFAAELRSQLDSLGAGVERDVVQSQLRQVEAGRDYFAKLGPARERIAARLERALTLRQRTVAAYEAAWQRARDELKEDDRFVDFALPDIPGLVPLGLNPTSGLQEFYLLDNGRGAIPSKQDHDYEVTADTGLIFVLIPARACGPPGTPDRCEVSPFLMSRYEMTQAQWVRLLAEGEIDAEEADRLNPSLETERIQSVCGVIELFPSPEKRKLLGFSAPNWVHPVQGMSWPVAQSRLARAGLQLPTMSEWNVCAYRIVNSRLTTDGLWSGGRGRYVNFWDRFGDAWFASGDLGAQDPDDDWDGFVFTCPVDALAPNELGLHGTFGNVAEYTCDSAESDPLADGGPQA
ncbi:MAG: protein kinase, partial [Planctomycetes bacterium]|nr:protein kinase [Planctomycetota bacterium]